jgi:hypothetical protein
MIQQLSQKRGSNMSHLSEEKLDQLVAEEKARQQQPLNEWRTIAARAREEGLIRESTSSGWASSQSWVRAAAAVVLLIGGIAIGRTTIALPSAISPTATTSNASFASVDDAMSTLDRAEADYQRASRFLAANNLSEANRDSSAIYTKRLAALDQVVNATESALQTAPHDPVINQYYLATMGARVATQQMATQQLVSRPVAALRGF